MPITPPAAADPAAETNPYLIRFKSSLVKRWSHTRMRELYEELDLATYLWALDRGPEALEILDSVTTAVPKSSGDYNIWSPVVSMHALQARILRSASAAPTRNVDAVLDDPGLADNPSYIGAQVTEAEAKFADADAQRGRTSACRRYSRALCPLFVLSELALAHHPFSTYYPEDAPDRLIQQARPSLATRLTA
ncbi:hypothetical protein [Actinomadura rupiterrae]|uniref:hypothetical protein n=1 Tax=Actinomadura rupiterrae TaxID=559627 RepID=UPI0020A38510|nr:hypothetical protein [Actinomadura rupiterrae]MCP2340623.1 hypothetical protein [Actinomadura rupiterrae]